MISWNKSFHGSIHLYGHVHNNENYDTEKRLNVGVDNWNFYPLSLDEIVELIKK